MAKTISITIPENLHESLQAVKDSLNVSGICQEAIASAVKIEELKKGDTENMEIIIERLRAEKKAFVKDCKEKGFKAGLEGAKELPYQDMVAFANGATPPHYEGWLEHELEDFLYDDPYFDADSYEEGWHNGVKEFWKQVKNKL